MRGGFETLPYNNASTLRLISLESFRLGFLFYKKRLKISTHL
jgi:hypothetical protein